MPQRLSCRLLILLILVLSSGLERNSRAADLSVSAATTEEIPDAARENGTYCGIYCVYAAVHSFGKKMDFTDLLKTRYVGTMFGSSIHELAAAVEDNGLYALPMMGMSRANLVASRTPIVLHVSRPDSPGYFGHWVLFLGMEDGQAKVLDAPHRPELVPVADILARWDGVGLYVSERPVNSWKLKAEAILTGENLGLFAALLIVTTMLQRFYRRRRGTSVVARPIWFSAPTLLVVPALLAVAWHLLSEDGYARNLVAVRTVIQQHRPSFLPKLAVSDMERAMQDKNVVIVDARYPRDYQSGHLPGAINVPVFTTQAERRKLLGNVPKQARIIVYCQSENCQFDEALGSALVAEGIENVALFPGGWTKWEQKTPKAGNEGKEKPSDE